MRIVMERGKTTYVLEDANIDHVKLTRLNSDGEQVTFFPKEMLLSYARDTVVESFSSFVRKALS